MRTLAPLLTLALVATACAPEDADGDGVPATLDCNDAAPDIYPGATEVCDGVDNDCNQVVDDDYARGGQIFFLDRDGDGAGVWELAKVRCAPPAGYVDNADDCADDDPDVYPGAPEFCDRIDQNCNSTLDDDAVDGTPYYTDLDGDGYGGTESVTYACEQPDGYIAVGGDCDDFSVIISPEAVERCNQIDDDCNDIIDDATSADATVWYADNDLDGFGDPEVTTTGCNQPEYFVSEAQVGDCNDADEAINPDANEVCNDGVDNNCNDSADSCSFTNWELGEGGMVEISGFGSSAYFGRDIAIVGDTNGDGYDDVLLGGYRAGGGTCSSGLCGGAMLVYGAADIEGSSFDNSTSAYYAGGERFEYAGMSVAGLGDLNNDGYDDFGIGSYSNSYSTSRAGAIYVVYGGNSMPAPGDAVDLNSVGMLFGSSNSYSYLGYGLTGGDFDGDGYSDLAAAAPRDYDESFRYEGFVYLRYGGASQIAFEGVDDLAYLKGEQSSEYFGGASGHGVGDGDFDGDGRADLLVGGFYYDHRGNFSTGRAYVIYGEEDRFSGGINAAEVGGVINGTTRYGYLGTAVAGVGDTNGDGYEDMAYCGYGEAGYAGRCYITLGGSERLEGAYDLTDDEPYDFYIQGPSNGYLGYFGVGGSDYDLDGLADIAVGMYQYRPDSSTYGAGAFGALPGAETRDKKNFVAGTDFTFTHATSRYSYLGSVSAESGDVNGDGYPDAAAGAYGALNYAGQGYIFFGGGL